MWKVIGRDKISWFFKTLLIVGSSVGGMDETEDFF